MNIFAFDNKEDAEIIDIKIGTRQLYVYKKFVDIIIPSVADNFSDKYVYSLDIDGLIPDNEYLVIESIFDVLWNEIRRSEYAIILSSDLSIKDALIVVKFIDKYTTIKKDIDLDNIFYDIICVRREWTRKEMSNIMISRHWEMIYSAEGTTLETAIDKLLDKTGLDECFLVNANLSSRKDDDPEWGEHMLHCPLPHKNMPASLISIYTTIGTVSKKLGLFKDLPNIQQDEFVETKYYAIKYDIPIISELFDALH